MFFIMVIQARRKVKNVEGATSNKSSFKRRKEEGSKEIATHILVMGSIMELFPLCNDYYKFNPIFCFDLLQMILEYDF